MAQNKILPWAQTSTANALSDADYAADVAAGGSYADGVKSGQASSKQANKTWRQATAPGAGLAQFIVDNLALDVTDADTPSTFSTRIANAVLKLAQISPFNQSWAAATGGYRKYAIVSDSSGNYWVSTEDQNTTVPGASGANWKSLLDGYATQDWANSAFVKNNASTQGGIVALDLDGDGSGRAAFLRKDGSWGILQPAGDYATNTALNTETTNRTNADTNLQNQIDNRVLKTGDTSTGTQYSSGWFWGGYNAGFGGGTETGSLRWTNFGISFGNPLASNNAAFSGNFCVSDIIGNVNDNSSGINMRGYDYQGKLYNWFFAWNGKVTTPGGVLAFESDLSGYVANTNPGIQGALTGTSLCVNPSDGRSYLAYSGNTKIDALAWYSDVVSEATARANADNNLQAQISAKMDGSFAASGLFDGSQGSTTSGTIVGGTWMRIGNTLTQNLVIENINGGTVTFPFAFSGNPNQVTVIVQDGTGSNNTYTTGNIQLASVGIHASGGGGTGRLHLTASGPYGT